MSHFTRLAKANIVSKESFIAACKELGLNEISTNTEITDWSGKREKVDVAAKVDGRYSVGLQKAGSKFDMLCDWSMAQVPEGTAKKIGGTGYARGEDLRDALLRATTKHTIVAQYRRQGFLAHVTENADRSINIKLTR